MAADPTPPLRPLDPLFSPRSIAVIGASRNRGSLGFALLHNLVAGEYEGAIFPVNPQAAAIHSLKCYPSVGAIPDAIDLAVVVVPKARVAAVVDECLEKGARGLVVITAGYGETGAAGRAAEQALRAKVRAAGARMIGPNCMGIINTAAGVRMNATFAPTPARPGSLGFVSQSGALGVAILNLADDLGVGLTQFASMGNKADVSGNDLLEHWEDDPATRVICMYLESFGNPQRFVELARRVGRKKPILVVKAGRTAEGARAASSHTGAIAGADVSVSAFLDQCGVLRADTIDELFDVARALDRCPLPAGNRVAIVTNAGGPGIMATDACVGHGLAIASLSAETQAVLRGFLPAEASVANPVDMIASANEESYRRSLAAVLADPSVDMALAINVTPLLSSPLAILESVAVAAGSGAAKPVLAVMMATDVFYESIKGRDDLPPVYRFPESAARTLAQLSRYAAWRRRPADEQTPRFAIDDAAVADLLDAAARRAAATGDSYLAPDEGFRLLELAGLPVARWRYVHDRAGVIAAGQDLGYPLVLKAHARGLVHKSELGAVRLDLRDPLALADAVDAMSARLAAAGTSPAGFLLQEMVGGSGERGGHETILGVSHMPAMGPLLMFGLGGKYVEVFRDVRFAVPPLAPTDARDLIAGIRGHQLLTGVRGEPPADVPALVEAILRLSQLALSHPRIAELDVNPFLAGLAATSGNVGTPARALDVRVRLSLI
jgi:acetyl coenzyme A synthetase (ADP forming)-like protein